jgi:hypothetical protein
MPMPLVFWPKHLVLKRTQQKLSATSAVLYVFFRSDSLVIAVLHDNQFLFSVVFLAQRYSMLVEEGVIKIANFEPEGLFLPLSFSSLARSLFVDMFVLRQALA